MTIELSWNELARGNVQRIQASMQSEGIDALVLAKNESTRYTTGYQRYFCATYLPFVHIVVLLQDRGPYLMLPEHIEAFGQRCYSERVEVLPMEHEAQLEAVAALLRPLDKKGAKIGAELDYFHAGFLNPLQDKFSHVEWTDAQTILGKVMAIKSPTEIEWLRRSSALNDKVVRAILEKAAPGMTELELGAEAGIALAGGAEFINHLCIRSDYNAYELGPLNTDRVLKDGDCLQLDTGFVYRGYVSDVNRTKIIGRPTADQTDVIKITVDVHMALMDMMKPGTRASDIYARCVELFHRTPLGQSFRMPFIAHGLGASLHEFPYVTPANHAVLEENMVIALEPGLYVPERGTCRMENAFVITADGYDMITDLPSDLEINGIG